MIKKRAMFNICPDLPYAEALQKAKLVTLEQRRMNICKAFFQSIQHDGNIVSYLLPKQRESYNSLRKKKPSSINRNAKQTVLKTLFLHIVFIISTDRTLVLCLNSIYFLVNTSYFNILIYNISIYVPIQ